MAPLLRGIVIALRAIRRNTLRAGLTVLGILIGVAAVVVMTALATGAREKVSGQIESVGSNVIMIFPTQSSASGARGAQGQGQRLTEDDRRAIERESTSLVAIAPTLRSRAQVIGGDRNISTSVFGTTLAFYTVRNWKVASGAPWTLHDEATKAKVCVLGTTVQRKLFGDQDPIGRSVRIGRYAFEVVGVLETKGEGPFGDQDDLVAMPIDSMRSRLVKTPPGMVGALMASATSIDSTERAVAQIDQILRQRHQIPQGREPDFAIRTQKEFQSMQEAIYGLLTILLVGIAAISLVVGGIGIMNIMLVSVTERTREIGIRMAIGAREQDIRTQFLVEAIVLSTLGGVSGAALGLAAMAGLSYALEWPMRASPVALAVSIGVSGLTGVVFGFFPARRASRLDPIVALRHE